jgi:hypothetical protein
MTLYGLLLGGVLGGAFASLGSGRICSRLRILEPS